MPPSLRALYAAHDGYFLAWQLKPTDRELIEPRPGPMAPFEAVEYEGAADGVICILPVEQAFVDWGDHANFPSEDYERVFGGKVPWPSGEEPGWEEEEERLQRRTRA